MIRVAASIACLFAAQVSAVPREDKPHDSAADATQCVRLLEDRDAKERKGSRRFSNACGRTVEVFWSGVPPRTENAGRATLQAGRAHPLKEDGPVRWGACFGAASGGTFRRDDTTRPVCPGLGTAVPGDQNDAVATRRPGGGMALLDNAISQADRDRQDPAARQREDQRKQEAAIAESDALARQREERRRQEDAHREAQRREEQRRAEERRQAAMPPMQASAPRAPAGSAVSVTSAGATPQAFCASEYQTYLSKMKAIAARMGGTWDPARQSAERDFDFARRALVGGVMASPDLPTGANQAHFNDRAYISRFIRVMSDYIAKNPGEHEQSFFRCYARWRLAQLEEGGRTAPVAAQSRQEPMHRPDLEAHRCLSIISDAKTLYGGFRNSCAYSVGFAWCAYRPKPDAWNASFDCEKPRGIATAGSVRALDTTASHTAGAKIYWFACRRPESEQRDVAFEPGRGLVGKCVATGR